MVRGKVEVFACHFTRSVIPPANRQTLAHRVESAEHGKPDCLHLRMGSDLQENRGTSMISRPADSRDPVHSSPEAPPGEGPPYGVFQDRTEAHSSYPLLHDIRMRPSSGRHKLTWLWTVRFFQTSLLADGSTDKQIETGNVRPSDDAGTYHPVFRRLKNNAGTSYKVQKVRSGAQECPLLEDRAEEMKKPAIGWSGSFGLENDDTTIIGNCTIHNVA